MIPSEHLKTVGLMPSGRFVTTYGSDYKPFSERHLQVNQLRPRPEAAPAFISPPQTGRQTWPIFHQYFYKTTNSTYGSGLCPQPPTCSLFPASLPPFGIVAPSVPETSEVIGSTLTGAVRQTGPVFGEVERGRLHYVFGGKSNVLEQQEAKDEPKQKIDVLYEEGVIVLSSLVCPACCEDFLGCDCRGLHHLLHPPVASSPIITINNAEIWDGSADLRGFRSAFGQRNSTFLQPASRQCACCAWEPECPDSCCFRMQTFPPGIPHGSTPPLAHVNYTAPSRKPLLTEYQASYTTEWAQPKIELSEFHHHHPPRHQRLYPSL